MLQLYSINIVGINNLVMIMKKYFEESANVKLKFIEEDEEKLKKAIEVIYNALKNGNKILICGNGGVQLTLSILPLRL